MPNKCERMPARVNRAPAIELELLAMLQPVEEPVAIRALHRSPRILRRAHARRRRQVARVARHREERRQMRAQSVDRSQVQRMIALAHVEGAAIHLHAFNCAGDENVRVGVAVAVRIRRQIIRQQVASHLDVLRDGLAVVASHSWRKILRRLDAARCRLNGIAGNGDRRAWPSRIRIEQILRSEHLFGRIGRHHIASRHIGRDHDRLRYRRLQPDLKIAAAGRDCDALFERLEMCRVHNQSVISRRCLTQRKPAECIADGSSGGSVRCAQSHLRARNGIASPSGHDAGDCRASGRARAPQ